MLVRDWMSKTVITADAEDSMQDAVRLLKDHGIKILPVLDHGKLAGIVTDRDLKRASASDATTLEIHELVYLLSKIKIKEVMTPHPVTVSLDATIEEAAQAMLARKISGVPVVDPNGEVHGIITQNDLFRVIISFTGIDKKGIQIGLQTLDRPGALSYCLDMIRQQNGRIMSVLSSREQAPEGTLRIYIRAFDIEGDKLEALKKEFQSKADILYLVDHQSGRRTL
ncbi:MAG: CBS domain-containing protein [Desulfobacteraceae bacterium]|nr:CBS domain-containing protein [Desulfobacteraceae bacterium]